MSNLSICLFLCLLSTTTYSKALSSCSSQVQCLNFETNEVLEYEGDPQYTICISWDSSLPECTKSSKDSISHACPGPDETQDPWEQGIDNAMCLTVTCGQRAEFGVKDGSSCKDTLMHGLIGELEVTCYDSGFCGGSADKECKWSIPAPPCPVTTTTTAAATTQLPGEEATTEEPAQEIECLCSLADTMFVDDMVQQASMCNTMPVCLYRAEQGCLCHDCDCGVIQDLGSMLINQGLGTLQVLIEQCTSATCAEFCSYDSDEEICVDAQAEVDETGSFVEPAFVYVRDTRTGMNTNPLFVVDYEEETTETPLVNDVQSTTKYESERNGAECMSVLSVMGVVMMCLF